MLPLNGVQINSRRVVMGWKLLQANDGTNTFAAESDGRIADSKKQNRARERSDAQRRTPPAFSARLKSYSNPEVRKRETGSVTGNG